MARSSCPARRSRANGLKTGGSVPAKLTSRRTQMAATGTGTFNNFIDGESVASVGGRTSDVLNPADGQAFAQAPDSTAEDIDRAVKAARGAFGGWSGTTPGERSLAL